MALQSQSRRPTSNLRSSVSHFRGRNRGQKRMVGVVLLLLCVGGGFVYLMRDRDGGGQSPLGPQLAKADGVTLPGVAPAVAPPTVTPVTTACSNSCVSCV